MPRAASATKKAAAKAPAPQPEDSGDAEAEAAAENKTWFAQVDDVVDYTNTLLYGREGGAKTTDSAFLANASMRLMPEGPGRVLIINAEGGVKKAPLRKRGIDTSRIVLWPDPTKHQRVTHRALDEVHRRVRADLEDDPNSWFGVVFDSATEIFTSMLDDVQQRRVAGIKRKGAEVDEDFVDIADYGTMSKQFRDQLRKFRDLPCHFVVTALERRDIDKDTGRPQYGPAVTPGLQADLLGYVDFVIMCKAEDEDGPFRGLTRANSRYRAKDRFDILPKVMVEPNMDRVLQYVEGTITPETDPLADQYTAKGSDVNKPKKKPTDDDDEETTNGDE